MAQQVSTLGEFHSAASSIAKSIHKVSQKLEHLTKREWDWLPAAAAAIYLVS